MSTTPVSSSIFRFVSVRPVQDVPQDVLQDKFISAGVLNSELVQSLDRASSFGARVAIAADFIAARGGNYVSGFDERAPWVQPLQQVLIALARAHADSDVGAAVQAVQDIVAASADLTDVERRLIVRRRLWDSVYATFLSPTTDARDRAELYALVRALNVVDHIDQIDNVRAARRMLRVEPLVPPRWLSRGSAAGSSNEAEPTFPTPGTVDILTRANSFRQRYFDLESAIANLSTVDRRARTSARASRQPVPRASASADQPQHGQVGSVSWRLPDEAIAALWPATRALIAENGGDLVRDTTAGVLESLRAAQRLAAQRLSRVGGTSALVNLDPVLKPVLDAGDLSSAAAATSAATGPFNEPYSGSVGSVRPLGIGDLLIVRDTLLGYEAGEVAYCENVMRTEHRERVFRQLDRVQTSFTTATQTTETSERDLESTDRYEMQNETAQTLTSDQSLSLGVGISASYGPVKVDTNAEFATSSSSSDSQTSSTSYAREVTDRSLSSIERTIQEKSVTRTLTETEETNTHGFDNTAGTEHVAGIYRWLSKRYRAQVMSYGKRLMLEFIVPVPAAFYHLANDAQSAPTVTLAEPEPLPADFSFRDIQPGTYQIWTDLYRPTGVEPPPPFSRTVGIAIDQPEATHGVKLSEDYILTTKTQTITLPAGYVAVEAWVTNQATVPIDGTSYSLRVSVGRHSFEVDLNDDYEPMENEDGTLPVAVKAYNVYAYAMTVEVRCERTAALLEAWQIATYEAVVTAYNNLKAAYDSQVAAASVQATAALPARSPDANRQIERDELKKGCIVLLTDQHFADAGAVTMIAATSGYPEIRVAEAMREGAYIQYIQQCCEWDQMTYTFYPYFWGRKDDWLDRALIDDTDPLFAAFLKAGAARVLVPVRRRYEKSLIYFLETATIWNGGAAPTINNPLYVSIVEEMQEAQDVAPEDATPYGDPWEYVVPTTLVTLQADATLPEFEPASS
jgi:hypothetical protein